MLHHLRLNDQRQEKQVNWHSPETLSWRIEAACLQTVKIFSLKLCSKKVCTVCHSDRLFKVETRQDSKIFCCCAKFLLNWHITELKVSLIKPGLCLVSLKQICSKEIFHKFRSKSIQNSLLSVHSI